MGYATKHVYGYVWMSWGHIYFYWRLYQKLFENSDVKYIIGTSACPLCKQKLDFQKNAASGAWVKMTSSIFGLANAFSNNLNNMNLKHLYFLLQFLLWIISGKVRIWARWVNVSLQNERILPSCMYWARWLSVISKYICQVFLE